MKYEGDWDSPFHDTVVDEILEREREHQPTPFRLQRWTRTCPGCGRPASPSMLEAPHYNPHGRPVCSSCRARGAKWFRTPAQRAASIKAREARRALGVVPNVGFEPEP
jgi:hypothetical protein